MKAKHLAELAALKHSLGQAQSEATQALARETAQRERLHHESTLFARSVGAVRSLRAAARAPKTVAPPSTLPRQRQLDEQAVLRESLSDAMDVETLLDSDGSLSYRRADVGPDVLRKLRRGHWAIQAQIDLHGMRRDEAREQLAVFVRDALAAGLRCLRVVHGKGIGSPGRAPVLKDKVRAWLVQKSEVIAFVQARASEGGSGALIVLLRP